jgi:aquaporin Z
MSHLVDAGGDRQDEDIILARLWSSPISGASRNPARSFGPDLVLWKLSHYWVYIVGPIAGGLVAVGIAYLLRGRGGGQSGREAEQGKLEEIVTENVDQPGTSAETK